MIVNHVPMQGGEVQELGDFELDGVAFPAAEVKVEFLDPAGRRGGRGRGGRRRHVPVGQADRRCSTCRVSANSRQTLINAGNPTIFVDAARLGLTGTELQCDVNGDKALLQRAEAVRALGAVAMGLVATPEEATAKRPHTPKLAFVGQAGILCCVGRQAHRSGSSIDLLARIFSMGVLHHAHDRHGTGAVAIAAAAAIPGTIVSRVAPAGADGRVRFGHPSGMLSVGAEAREEAGQWKAAPGDDEPVGAAPDGRLVRVPAE